MLCLNHLSQIKQALGITGVQSLACSWRSNDTTNSAQIDLIIDRKDNTVNLCEIKYANDAFEITKDYEARLIKKINTFTNVTATRKSLILTMITSFGVKPNTHSAIIQKELTLNDLFRP